MDRWRADSKMAEAGEARDGLAHWPLVPWCPNDRANGHLGLGGQGLGGSSKAVTLAQ